MRPIRRILFPTDFSEYADDAWPYATRFGRDFGAELHVLHVLTQVPGVYTDGLAYGPKDLADHMQAEARHALERLVDEAKQLGLAASASVRSGVAFQEILDYAHAQAIDLIVMATHGRTGLAHALLGSVTERVVRRAPCPVLTVRHPAMRV
ncbi:MAG: universal stress protein [Acidobacteria bacterium]|nr:MAG: universal stress protein [Acidobacteriota bacterium]